MLGPAPAAPSTAAYHSARGPRLRPRGVARPRRGGGAAARRPGTLALDHRASEILPELGDAASPTYTRRMVETASPCPGTRRRRSPRSARCASACARPGATLIGGGIHPTAPFGEAPHVPGERYDAIAASDARASCAARPTCALHVHVGHARPRQRDPRLQRPAAYLPVLQASPRTRRTGTAWTRASQRPRAAVPRLPRAIIPPAFAGWTTTRRHVGAMAGGRRRDADYTFLWWDIGRTRGWARRAAGDGPQSRLASVAGLAALVHGLALARARRPRGTRRSRPRDHRELVPRGPRRAGGDAALGRGHAPLRELAAEAIGVAGAALREHGAGDGALEEDRADRAGGQTAPTGCAPRTRRAGCARCSSGSSPRRLRARRAEATGARTAARSRAPSAEAPSISAITGSGSQLGETRAPASC
jgi:hypothetical protein